MRELHSNPHTSHHLLGFLEGESEVVSPVLRLQTEPVEVVRVEDVDEGAEGEAVIPVSGEISHRNLKISPHSIQYQYPLTSSLTG